MKIFKLFMVLDMLKSNLRDYLYAREQEEKYIFIFFKLLKCVVIFSCTQLCLMLGAVLINPALTKLSVIHALPKEENLNILSQNIYRKILPKEKTYFFVRARLKKIQYVRQKTKLLIIGNLTKMLSQHYFRIRPKQTSGKALIERIG